MKKIIIIGAARSGTNMLRDILSSTGSIVTWPCDEINYIWRYGNARSSTDEFSSGMASDRQRKYIQKKFSEVSKKGGSGWVLEKTCANSLRVDFIEEIFPDALYIHIIRDGRDVACSARERWTSELDLSYLLKKVRFVPARDLLFYGSRYLWSKIHQIFSKDNRLSTWGPRFEGIDEVFDAHTTVVASGIQWMKCVESSQLSFKRIPLERVITVSYEDFTRSPREELERIVDKFDLPLSLGEMESHLARVSSDSVGRWKDVLSPDEVEAVESICGPLLTDLGYR
ncbi:MAG: sulfotransferase family protein [Porticoccaceae bacterium]